MTQDKINQIKTAIALIAEKGKPEAKILAKPFSEIIFTFNVLTAVKTFYQIQNIVGEILEITDLDDETYYKQVSETYNLLAKENQALSVLKEACKAFESFESKLICLTKAEQIELLKSI